MDHLHRLATPVVRREIAQKAGHLPDARLCRLQDQGRLLRRNWRFGHHFDTRYVGKFRLAADLGLALERRILLHRLSCVRSQHSRLAQTVIHVSCRRHVFAEQAQSTARVCHRVVG